MNFFTHAYRFLNQPPHFLAGLAVPDWLSMVDRSVRVRRERALDFVDDPQLPLSSIARGVVQHHDDDRWFHETAAFAQTHNEFTQQIARVMGNDTRFRPFFVSHITIEMLLDAVLAESNPESLDEYYALMGRLDGEEIGSLVQALAGRPTTCLARFVPRYAEESFVRDYLSDVGTTYRLNRILLRLGAPTLPAAFADWLPSARATVRERCGDLLTPPDAVPATASALEIKRA